jgi:glycosyltransferase involved in cell wall biosynthesis
MKLSVVIPAHNEESYITSCFASIRRASNFANKEVEIVTVLNRCTDNTKKLALENGSKIIENESRNLSNIRNSGVKFANGDAIITIDADSQMSLRQVKEVYSKLESNNFIGGGTPVRFNRKSLGIKTTQLFLDVLVHLTGLPCGSFWFRKDTFQNIGGFNEKLNFGEDMDFAKRLLSHGKKCDRKYGCLAKSFITTSSRKFDRFGDWHFFKLILFENKKLIASMNGSDLSFVNEFFYDFN